MDSAYKPLCLTRMLEAQQEPTLGEIAYASKGDWKWKQRWLAHHRPADAEQQRSELWQAYDDAFGARPDYCLWRKLYRPNHLPSNIAQADVEALVSAGVDGSSLIVWGTIASVAGLLGSGARANGLSADRTIEVATSCSRAVQRGLTPLIYAPCGCAAIRLLLLSALDRAWFEFSAREAATSMAYVVEYLNQVESLIRQIDPEWQVGRTVTIRGLYGGRTGPCASKESAAHNHTDTRPVLPLSIFEFAVCLRNIFHRAQFTVRDVARKTGFTPGLLALLQRGFGFALSAWLSARSLRMAEEQRQEGWFSRMGIDRLRVEELKALRWAALTAGHAGRYGTAACLNHRLLWTSPQERDGPQWDWFKPERFIFNVRQMGFDVPPRYCDNRSAHPRYPLCQSESRAGAVTALSDGDDDGVAGEAAPEDLSFRVETASHPLALRLEQEQGKREWWARVQRVVPGKQSDASRTLGRFVFLAQNGKVAGRDALSAAFNLCLSYRQIADAARLLETRGFVPNNSELLRFSDALASAQALMPWGIDTDEHREWQEILRDYWGRAAAAPFDENLSVYETLLGRMLTTIRFSESEAIAAKYYGKLSEEEIGAMYDAGRETRQLGQARADVATVREALRKLGHSDLGTPIAVSVVWLGHHRWGLVCLAADGKQVSRRLQLRHDLHDEAAAIRSTPDLYKGVPWGDGLLALGQSVIDAVNAVDSAARWVIVATEPFLAKVPWQHMFAVLRYSQLLVSLVPSLTWAAVAADQPCPCASTPLTIASSQSKLMARHAHASLSDAERQVISEQYAELRNEVQDTSTAPTTSRSSIAVVLGHGEWDEQTEMTAVVAPDAVLGWERWLEVAEHRLVIVHACSAGRVAHQFLGDIAGLPSIALGQRCRLFAAPVAEVQPDTATAFQRAFIADTKDTVGSRYLRAMEEDPNVALYNLWGFPSELVGT